MARLFDQSILNTSEDALEFIENILDSSTEYSIIGKDLNGEILLWNEGAHRIYGYDAAEIVGKANSSILHTPEDIEAGKHRAILTSALENGKWEGTLNRVRKDGARFTARIVITPRRDVTGKPVGYLLISKDISSEIRLTEQLRDQQFYTRSLIESSVDGLITVDQQGIINDRMCAMTGYARGELLGTPFADYFTDPGEARRGVQQTLEAGFVTEYALTLVSRSRRLLNVSFNASVFRDVGGEVRGIFASARDRPQPFRNAGYRPHDARGFGRRSGAQGLGIESRLPRALYLRPHGSRRP